MLDLRGRRLWLLGYRALMQARLLEKRLRKWPSSASSGPAGALCPRGLPRRIWMYWDKGEAAAPEIVRYCIAHWRELHPTWELTVLDRNAADAIIDMSDVPDGILPAHYADILRLRLLKQFGGVWADATCLPMHPLESWLPCLMQSGFFAFDTGGRNRPLSNWFLASEIGGIVVSRWEEKATSYWIGRSEADTYLWVHHLFEWLLRTDRDVRACWHQTPRLHSDMALLLKRALTGKWDESATLARLSEAGSDAIPIHKLTWKEGTLERAKSLLNRLSTEFAS